jgi:hypothetical protein
LQNDVSKIREVVLEAINAAGQPMLVSMLDGGEWALEGNELLIKVAASSTIVDMSLGADAKRIMIASASGALGRPVKVRVVPGAAVQAPPPGRSASNGVGGRSRVEQDPVVQRMREKFGAEIRTIIDYQNKK